MCKEDAYTYIHTYMYQTVLLVKVACNGTSDAERMRAMQDTG